MNITPWTIYIWQQADVIVDFCRTALTPSVILALFGWIFTAMAGNPDIGFSPGVGRPCRIIAIIASGCTLLFLLLHALIPRSNTIAMMYVLPEIANSRVVQQDLPEIYDAAIKALKQQLEK